MADFVWSVGNNNFMNKMRKSIIPLNCRSDRRAPNTLLNPLLDDAAKSFALDIEKGSKKDPDLIPPPLFSDQSFPFNYQ